MNCTHESNYYTLSSEKVCASCLISAKLGNQPKAEIIKAATRYYAKNHCTSVASVRSSRLATKDALVEYINDGHV